MRTFRLINEKGQAYALNDVQSGFLYEPSGMGYALEYSYTKIGALWKENYVRNKQGTISATMLFAGSTPYNAEKEFLAFVRQSKDLKLERTTTAGVIFKDVLIVSYEISEITEGNLLLCPLQMLARSLWYTNTSEKATIIGSLDDEVRYSYSWPSRFNDYSNGYLTFNNDGSEEAAFTLDFHGGISNPSVELDVNGVVKYTLDIPETVSIGSRIIWSSVDGNLYCYKGTDEAVENFKATGDTTGLTNIVDQFDIANTNFFKFPVGTSRLHITADSALTNPILVSIYKYYRAT